MNCTAGIGKYYDANTGDITDIIKAIADDINQIYLSYSKSSNSLHETARFVQLRQRRIMTNRRIFHLQ